jgi:hypothetical protein
MVKTISLLHQVAVQVELYTQIMLAQALLVTD